MTRSTAELKRKLRDLKRLEINLRFAGNANRAHGNLVWDEFFSTKSTPKSTSRYDLQTILNMERDEFKDVLVEFFYFLYFRMYQEGGLSAINLYDHQLLESLGLPVGASDQEIKSRFRALAKKYHPDLGGDAGKFIELMGAYQRLTGTG